MMRQSEVGLNREHCTYLSAKRTVEDPLGKVVTFVVLSAKDVSTRMKLVTAFGVAQDAKGLSDLGRRNDVD
jgi:hypothetical protein